MSLRVFNNIGVGYNVYDQFGALLQDPSTSIKNIPFVANDNISAFQVVTSNGKIANSSNVAHKNKIIGISLTDVLIGFSGTAIGFGIIQNSAWTWTIGDKIFLNGTSLSITAPATGFSLLIATAIAIDTLDIIMQPSILL
jgi:hypothetical protein